MKKPAYASAGSRFYPVILTVMTVVVILSNIAATKGVQLGWFITDGGFFLFPLAYICGDITTEVYGFKAARKGILVGFVMSFLAVVCFEIVILLPGFTDDWSVQHDAAMEMVLGPVWQIVVAGLLGFLGGQLTNSFIMVRGKARNYEKRLIARLMSSTGVGEIVDTVIFCSIAASVIGIQTFQDFVKYTVFGAGWKIIAQYAVIPITTQVIKYIKQHEPSYEDAQAISA
ncbi:queuosine precursor transporter [Boudabousia liubingyangii]|uniref:queuosine precursor transporter n=1 Tax=Boudabousia liubingyangii TaxID=1921764 RepID=UPI000ABAFC53|nr:queuosine precursor transporter [Boudabousia liubingyangii]